MSGKPVIRAFFDEATNTVSYLVADPETRRAAVIDPVLDYDPKSGVVDDHSVKAIVAAARAAGDTVDWSLETHAHADHLSGSPYVKAKTGAKIGIGEHIKDVQQIFRPVFNATDLKTDGSDFDHLFADGERYQDWDQIDVPGLSARPGHTPACMTHVIERCRCLSAIRCSCRTTGLGTMQISPAAMPRQLYRSIQTHPDALPPETRLFMCHDYKPPGRDAFACESTVAAEKLGNIHVRDGTSEDDFVRMRTARDATLAMPTLLLPAVQVNMRAGRFPPAEANGVRFLKIPVKFKPEAEIAHKTP